MTLDAETEAEIAEGAAFIVRAPKLMEILDAVSAVYRVGKMDMMSLRRFSNMVEARDAFYWLARHLTPRTYVEIGRFFADRDHSTVFEGVSRASMRFPVHKKRLVEVCKRLNIKINIEGL
jgi:chromosomal replication initiation ATPase DnaA